MAGQTPKRGVIWCGPDDPATSVFTSEDRFVRLNSFPDKENVHIKYENISGRLCADIPPICMDLLEIGAYVYCADQTISRGGRTWRGDGKHWIRNLAFHVPVRNLDVWNQEQVKKCLVDALSFLSDDNYEFSFRQLQREVPSNYYFDFYKDTPRFEADSVLLFSGGLDSLAGAVDEVRTQGRKTVLVSHRPVAKIDHRQRNLLAEFNRLLPEKNLFLHVPVWANKDSGLTKDTSQRTRSFLYAMLGACVALMHGHDGIKFYENGIVSANLPFSDQIVGARASRSTHPKALYLMSRFLGSVLGREFRVENPFFWKTKSDVVQVLKDQGMSSLIRLSNSCSHTQTTDRLNNHCGACSQCVERRLATLYNGLTDDDPEEMYKIRLFVDELEKGDDRVMVGSLMEHFLGFHNMEPPEFFSRFGEVNRLLNYLDLPASEAAERIYELHRRQGEQTYEVVKSQIEDHSDMIADKRVSAKSLLAMLIKQRERQPVSESVVSTFPTPEGAEWEDVSIEITSRESARISVDHRTQTYNAFEMGFADNRQHDMLNMQWKLLMEFAEYDGVLSWASRMAEPGKYKQIHELKKTLSQFFGIQGNPIKRYKKGVGYVTRFRISDKSYGKS